jgi:4-aminobutyrate aminotransferase-like enzyme/aminoglycoside phosphotransferase (APT) family kinase protein
MSKNMNNVVFTTEEVKNLVRSLYGLKVSVKPLVSERDWNFLLQDEKGERFIFKVANQNETLESLESQNRTMEYLAAHHTALKYPRVCRTLEGKDITGVKSSIGTTHLVRMLTYLPGRFMGDMEPEAHSPELVENLGRFLGEMDRTLENFQHPALHKYFYWDLKHTADLEDHLDTIKDLRLRNLVHYFILQFKTVVMPVLPKLRTSVIHNDANDYNILVADDGKEIAGIIDFGDMVHTYTVCEPAIAVAYAIHGKDNPLETAARLVHGYYQEYPLTEKELEVLFYLACARLCATLVISSRQSQQDPTNEYLAISLEPARKALEQMILIDPQQACNTFREACGFPVEQKGSTPEQILEMREKQLGKSLSVSYKKPLKIVRGFMQYLYDHTGRAYLDTVNNVCHVGHCHPRVVKAAQDQIALLNTNTRYLHDHIVEYAQELSSILPEQLSVCFFVNSGSEANELALRMARIYTGNRDFVVVDHAYHGNTNAVIEISPYKFDGPGGSGAPDHVHKTLMPDLFRGLYKAGDPGAGEKYAADVRRTFNELEAGGRKAAAFIHESMPSVAGQIVLPENYLKNAYRFAREAGAVCIADEVQVGFGRVGTHMWAFETQGVVPDIVTMGKPIGNGHPLAAVVTTPEIADAFDNGMEYFNTFGGNPVSCAVGLAVLDVIRTEKLQDNALETGRFMLNGLRELKDKHPHIGDVRGLGLFIGIELVRDRETLTPAKEEAYIIAEQMKEEGILVSVDGPLYNVIKIKPPLVFTKDNAQRYIDTLDKICLRRPKPFL